MHHPKRISLLAAGACIVAVGVRAAPIIRYGNGNLHHELHWMVYGYDRVWYRHRD